MRSSPSVIQTPAPGEHLLRHRGDTLTIELQLDHPEAGRAFVRTNIGQAAVTRREISDSVAHERPRLECDWHDYAMTAVDDRTWRLRLGLADSGYFEVKAYFMADGDDRPTWPPGPNTGIKVEPAAACAGNVVYNAFVRQFGPRRGGGADDPARQACVQALDADGFTVVPPSGTFRDLIAELDFIIGRLGCRILLLLPIHPTPTTYGRMGRFGSPYAALSFTEVDPALAVFDPHATPLEQFAELVAAVHARGARLFLDIAINHTGWAARLHEAHPEWLVRDAQGRIEEPGAWGVTWADLTRLDYRRQDLWRYMADVFLTWCRRGVDGFRCDAGYMIPTAAWTYMTARVREQFPETVFLLEGLGGKLSVTRRLLGVGGMDWAYSELFQNYTREQIEAYLPGAGGDARQRGLMVHFAETHDNNRLAARSASWARLRCALCALGSVRGGFGFANGVEWLAREKIDVHEAVSLNWGAAPNLVDFIGRLNRILTRHPAFFARTRIERISHGAGEFVVLLRRHALSGKSLIVVINLDDRDAVTAAWPVQAAAVESDRFYDLISGAEVAIQRRDGICRLPLEGGQSYCLSAEPADLDLVAAEAPMLAWLPRVENQRLRAKILEVLPAFGIQADLGARDLDSAAAELAAGPAGFLRTLSGEARTPRSVDWCWPQDLRREVMVPPGQLLLLSAAHPFRIQVRDGNRTLAREEAMASSAGGWFALLSPLPAPARHRRLALKIAVYAPAGPQRDQSTLLLLSEGRDPRVRRTWHRRRLARGPSLVMSTNPRGTVARAAVDWGTLSSRYDALLAANINPHHPEDRWIMWTRCRAWVVFEDYSRALGIECLETLVAESGNGHRWHFRVPVGRGRRVDIEARLVLDEEQNALTLGFRRRRRRNDPYGLPDDRAVRLILRPDLENRGFHEVTKAYRGPEHQWPAAVQPAEDGFTFSPQPDRHLTLRAFPGRFVSEPKWLYMVHRPLEAERGLDPDSDLFSPGYLFADLIGGGEVLLTARVSTSPTTASSMPAAATAGPAPAADDHAGFQWVLEEALEAYLVRRGSFRTVIAGYPWFLDWGRDTLIVTRGLIAAGRLEDARKIIRQFARFERDGTLPNMIRGKEAANHDTSDAPLWLFVAVDDLLRAEGGPDFLDADCGSRNLRRVLLDMGTHLLNGTPNGIRADPESGLLFSPSHFTWMDTNHPAGTPREGYPVEIQALWSAALRLLARIDTPLAAARWEALAGRVRRALRERFFLPEQGYLSDCLHARPETGVAAAAADDHLRPNQLLAITLGALDDPQICRRILAACGRLLVPGAIRSLDDSPVRCPLAIEYEGRPLADPNRPYRGHYRGDEDQSRKPAYHNGTAWTWIFPSFCEAWVQTYGHRAAGTARAWLSSAIEGLEQGCAGHVPEIMDGDRPHRARGCDAQAWGTSELLRVWILLERIGPSEDSR